MLKPEALNEIDICLMRYPALGELRSSLLQAVEWISHAARSGNKLLVCGNGGSAADSLHIVGELMKGFVLDRRLPTGVQALLREKFPEEANYYAENLQQGVPAIALVNEVSLITAYSNDNCADLAFAQQVLGYGACGDILIAISTSGNSVNVVHAARIAQVLGMKVIALTGAGGGRLADLSDVLLAVPSKTTYQIQEYHLPIYHALCLAVEKELFSQDGN